MTPSGASGGFFSPRRIARAVLAVALAVGAVYLVSRRAGVEPRGVLALVLSLLAVGLRLLPLPGLLSGRGAWGLPACLGGRPLRAWGHATWPLPRDRSPHSPPWASRSDCGPAS